MPSRPFAIALQRKLAFQQRRREARWQEARSQEREAKAREIIAGILLQQMTYVYGLYGLQPPPEARNKLIQQIRAQSGNKASVLLAAWQKTGLVAAEPRRQLVVSHNRNRQGRVAETVSSQQASILIKRYAGRRLYDTARCCYVSREEVAAIVSEGRMVMVHDAKTGADVTSEIV